VERLDETVSLVGGIQKEKKLEGDLRREDCGGKMAILESGDLFSHLSVERGEDLAGGVRGELFHPIVGGLTKSREREVLRWCEQENRGASESGGGLCADQEYFASGGGYERKQ